MDLLESTSHHEILLEIGRKVEDCYMLLTRLEFESNVVDRNGPVDGVLRSSRFSLCRLTVQFEVSFGSFYDSTLRLLLELYTLLLHESVLLKEGKTSSPSSNKLRLSSLHGIAH